MTLDPTILALTVALAAAAALYLAIEWRSVREPSLLFWSAGFCHHHRRLHLLALLRINGYLLIGIWFANGLLRWPRTACFCSVSHVLPMCACHRCGC